MIPLQWCQWMEDGPAILLTSRNQDGTPEVTRCVGLRVDSPTSLRLTLNRLTAGPVLENLGGGRTEVAALVTRIQDFHSMQLKGHGQPVELEDADVRASARYGERVLAICRAVYAGLPSRGYERFTMNPAVCVRVTVSEIYDQTPGPGAGKAIAGVP
jgi:hypothetical protein